jgi:putative Holliday junction resolvase
VDVGDKRVGIARGSSSARIAEPLKTVPADKALEEIAATANELQADGIVVGLPRGLDGQETAQTEKIRGWVRTAQHQIELPFYWQDEALTSAAIEKSATKAGIDAAAAAVILQDFLDTPVQQRVRC